MTDRPKTKTKTKTKPEPVADAKPAKKPAPTFAGFLAACVADCIESSS